VGPGCRPLLLDACAGAAAAFAAGEAGCAAPRDLERPLAGLGLELQALLERPAGAFERGAAVGEHGLLRERGQALGVLERALEVTAVGYYLVDEPHLERLRRGDDPPGQDHVHRATEAEDARVVVGLEALECLGQQRGGRSVDRVAPLGAVDRHDRGGAAALVDDLLAYQPVRCRMRAALACSLRRSSAAWMLDPTMMTST